ncbi:MAG: NAD(P)/FAD-dependent oxidoreductase, partial [Acholeplasmataceae bacterium]|nr:NAD(P)/FAD-dependent oxidoreductase [Acholeplasmataceae bacterium]
MRYDYVVIGSGIVGANIARELAKYKTKVLVLEKENDAVNGQTIANSAIIHAGHDPKEGSLKARLCVEGNKLYDSMEKELSIPLLRTGGFVVARGKDEEILLHELYQRALFNQVLDAKILDIDEARKLEPLLTKNATKVLSLPTTKVTYPWEVAFACLENAILNGVEFQKNSEVTGIKKIGDSFRLEINFNRYIETRNVINAAGIFADQIAHMLENNVGYQIKPRKGEYLVLDRKAKDLYKHVLYALPSDKGKGVLVVPQVHGNVLIGPTSTLIEERDLLSNTKSGFDQIKIDVKRLVDSIPYELNIRTFAGIRASSTYDDFYIKESIEFKGFYHVAGIDSPGLTAAPAIAKYLVEHVISKKLVPNENFNPIRIKEKAFHHMTDDEKHD